MISEFQGKVPGLHHVPRRTILSGTLGGLAFSALALMSGTEARASDLGSTIRLFPGPDSIYIPMPDGLVFETPRILGGTLLVDGETLPSGSIIRVLWDDRIYESGVPTLYKKGRELKCHALGKPVRQKDGRLELGIKIGEPLLPKVDHTFRVGTGRSLQYPNEIISGPLSTAISVQSAGKATVPGSSSARKAPINSAVWGAKLGASWVPAMWGDGFYTWRPDFVTVLSVGPDAIPSGTLVQVQLDRRIFDDLSLHTLADVAGPVRSSVKGQQILSSWTLSTALAAGQRLTLEVRSTFINPPGEVATLEAPTVTVSAAKAAIGQRSTGQESLTRFDNATTEETKGLFAITQH